MINITGNYGFLGFLSLVHALSLLDDSILGRFFPNLLSVDVDVPQTSFFIYLLAFCICVSYILVSLVPLVDTFNGQIPWLSEFYVWMGSYPQFKHKVEVIQQKQQDMLERLEVHPWVEMYWMPFWELLERAYILVSPLRIINRYAKFGTINTKRWELIIEGSNDREHWKPYEFKYKPGNVTKRPPIIPMHLPGLDWRIWFLPLGESVRGYDSFPEWYKNFLNALLQGNKDVLALLEKNPFPDAPPCYLRTMVYAYKFCYGDQKEWYSRELITNCGVLPTPESD